MIVAHELRKSFGKVNAVHSVSLTAPDGRITGLLGPNGAGKTTTMRILSSLVAPDGGRAEVDGFDVTQHPEEVRARLGVLPDARGLYPRLTTRENIVYFARLQGLDASAAHRRTEALIAELGLEALADRKVDGFSQGERAKVAIARALVHEPSNVLLDEPTNGLDVMSTRSMRTVIRGLRDAGRCVILSTHVMPEVSALCDEVFVIASGRVVAHGTPEALREQTRAASLEDAFVTLIGSGEGLLG